MNRVTVTKIHNKETTQGTADNSISSILSYHACAVILLQPVTTVMLKYFVGILDPQKLMSINNFHMKIS